MSNLILGRSIPESLRKFLVIPEFIFVGVGIQKDVDKLFEDWTLKVESTMVDLAEAAADKYKVAYYRTIGLKRLALELLGKFMKKPKHVILSQRDSNKLSDEQVEHAAIDAYVCFELRMSLMKNGRNGRRPGSSGQDINDNINVNDGPTMDHYYDDPNPFDDDPVVENRYDPDHNDGLVMD